MKKIRRALALMIAAAMLASVVSCQKEVTAENLMENVTEGNASEVFLDDGFCQYYCAAAFNLLRSEYKANKSNVVVSPLAAYYNLALLTNGASGKNKSDLEKLIGKYYQCDTMNTYMHSFNKKLENSDNTKMYFGNALWFNADKNAAPSNEFLATAKTHYDMAAYKESFGKDAVNNINNWASNNTDMYAEYIIDSLPSDAPAYIVNTTVLEGQWESPVSPENVLDSTFTNASEQDENVQMMSSYEKLYLSNDMVDGFIKPYSGGNYAFLALVPKKNAVLTMDHVLDYFCNEKYYMNMIKDRKERTVDASIPKFSVQGKGGMKADFAELNLGRSFDPTEAQLDMLGTCDGNMYVDDIFVYTGITVTEKGTSKGTGASVRDSSVATNVIPVALNRPFIFAVVDANRYIPIILGICNSVTE